MVWKHILNVYPEGMSGKERMDYMKKKAYEYQTLRDCWKEMVQNGQVSFLKKLDFHKSEDSCCSHLGTCFSPVSGTSV